MPLHPELGALLLADGRLPIGGHAHSSGLEPAVAAGLTPADVPEYMRARLRSVVLVEAAAAVLSVRAARREPVQLDAVHDALLARTPCEPIRASSGLLGRGLARLLGRLWPENEAVKALGDLGPRPQRPVALGVAAALVGMSDEQVARGCLYDDTQTVAAAALKLLPVDPADTARWVLDAGTVIEESVERAVGITLPTELPAITAPLVEQWALEHANRARRIFVA